MEFRLLGEVEVLRGGERVDLGSPRQKALLARLLVSANEVVAIDRLLEDLWPYGVPDSARQVVHVYVSRLRRVLAEERDRLERHGSGYCFVVTDDELDTTRFSRLAAEATAAAVRSEMSVAHALFTEALALWRGPALCEFPDDPFAREEAVRLERLRLDAVEQRLWVDLALGREREILAELHDLTTEHPLRETLWEQLMLALYRSGQQAEALRTFDRARLNLVTELGIEPGPSLQALEDRILRQDPSLVPGAAVGTTSLTRHLPPQRTTFVGRARELAKGHALLDRTRLLTVVGPPGSGKTRLAVRLAEERADRYADGVYFVPLASVRDPDFVAPAIADGLGLRTADGEDVEAAVVQFLRIRAVLLVLDNYEHLVGDGALVGRLIDGAPDLVVLVTSRVPLRLMGEQRYPLPPMETPVLTDDRIDGTIACDASELFLERAMALDPDFTVTDGDDLAIARIVHRLDGIPLAIELAAAKTQDFGVVQLADHLDVGLALLTEAPRDAEARHQTMEAAIAWSYDLLDDDERRMFRILGAFMGDFTVESASVVSGCEPARTVVLLERLGTHQLIHRPATSVGVRYAMLELIREYAEAMLSERGDLDDTRARHARYFADQAVSVEQALTRDPSGGLTDRIQADLANVRAALWFATGHGEPDLGLELAAALWRFWLVIDRLDEIRRWLVGLLETGGASPSLRARGLSALGGVEYWRGDYDASFAAYEAVLPLYRDLGDRANEAATLYALSTTSNFLGLLDDGERYATAARAMFEELGDRAGVAGTYMAQGHSLWWRGMHADALDYFERSLEECRACDDAVLAATVLVGIAVLSHLLGDNERAIEVGIRAVEQAGVLENAHSVVWSLDVLAAIAVDVAPQPAVELAGAADALRKEAGGGWTAETLGLHSARESAAGLLDEASIERSWAIGASLSMDGAMARACELRAAEVVT